MVAAPCFDNLARSMEVLGSRLAQIYGQRIANDYVGAFVVCIGSPYLAVGGRDGEMMGR
jgi:hypothetical protein